MTRLLPRSIRFWLLSHLHTSTHRSVTLANRLHPAWGLTKVRAMNALQGRMVVVPAEALDDLLELTRLATDRLPDDQLSRSLRASAAQIRVAAVVEP
jgi:hypothetical protein